MRDTPERIGQSTHQRSLGRTLPALLLAALLVWLPLPFASVTRFGNMILEVTAFTALALTLLLWRQPGIRFENGFNSWLKCVTIPALTLAGIAVLGLLQSWNWSHSLVNRISPEHVLIQTRVSAIVAPLERDVPATLSVSPAESRSAALLWSAIAACFAAAGITGLHRSCRHWFVLSIGFAALIQILYGAIGLGTGFIWGVDVRHDASRFRGTFVNPDHLAVYLEIALAVVFAWSWWAIRRFQRSKPNERRAISMLAPSLLWLTLFVGLAYTGSRAGLVAVLFSIMVQAALVARLQRSWRVGLFSMTAAIVGLAAVVLIGSQQGLGRWLSTSSYSLTWNYRFTVYEESFRLWHRFPWTGSGLGTFHEAFPLVQPSNLPLLWDHAHNDVLELLVTTGVVGLGLFMIGLAVLVHGLAESLTRGVRSEDRAAALGALGALAALGIHSWFDFGLTNPANAATLAIVCGAAVGALGKLKAAR